MSIVLCHKTYYHVKSPLRVFLRAFVYKHKASNKLMSEHISRSIRGLVYKIGFRNFYIQLQGMHGGNFSSDVVSTHSQSGGQASTAR